MGVNLPENGEPGATGAPVWHIVEHVPLPPGRALPAPRTADAAPWDGRDDEPDEADESTDGVGARARPPDHSVDDDAPFPAPDATGIPPSRRGTHGPTKRPLFEDLDHLLARTQQERARTWQPPSGSDEWTGPDGQPARPASRRGRAVLLICLVLLAVAVVFALLALGVHLPHQLHLPHLP